MPTLDNYLSQPFKKKEKGENKMVGKTKVKGRKRKTKAEKVKKDKIEEYYKLEPELEKKLWAAADKLRKKAILQEIQRRVSLITISVREYYG